MAELAPITVEGSPTPAPQQEVRAIPTEDPGHVAFTSPEGEVKSLPMANAQKAIDAGYRPATDVEYYRAKTGVGGTIMAGVTGFSRGLSFGTSDALTVGASRLLEGEKGAEEMRQTLRLLKEGHETAALVGEIGGSLAPLALGVGAGAVGAAEGGSALARAGSRAVAALPRAALEGAAIGVGQQLSEDTLGNHNLAAQKYVAAALEGGLLGALVGAGLHAGGGAIADRLAGRGGAAAEKVGAGPYRTAGAVSAAEKAEGTVGSKLGTKLADMADEQAAKALLPSSTINASELQKLGRTVEEQQGKLRRIGRTVLDEGIVTAGADKATIAQRVTRRVAEVGEELGSIRASLEKAAVRPSAEAVIDRIGTEVLGPLMERPFSAAEQASVKPFVAELVERIGGRKTFESFDELHKLRVALDKKLDPKLWSKIPGTAPAGFQELGQIRGILESEFERAAESAAVELGDNVAQKYRVTKALFGDLKTAEKWSTKAAARAAQNRAVSLTDTIAAGHGATAAIAGLAAGHPAAALGLLAGPANKALRTYGNQAAAVIADKAARILGVQRAAEAFDNRLQRAVKGFYGGKGSGARTPSKTGSTIDPQTRKALREVVKNPAVMTERAADIVERTGLRTDAPRVAQGISSVLMRAALYVGNRLPNEPPPATFTFGSAKPRALGPREQAKLDAVAGALDTDSLLAELEQGRLDRQKVEALKFIKPDLHAEIVKALVAHGQENAATLSHQQEVALSILTGRPIGAMMQPRTILGFQQAHASQGPAPDPAAGGGQTKPIGSASGGGMSRAATTLRSGSDRMEADDG